MKGISNLVVNMYRESPKFEYKGKLYMRTIALSKTSNGDYISGYILKHYALNAHIVYDVKLDILHIHSFKTGRMLKHNLDTLNLFKAVKQVIRRFQAANINKFAA